MMFALGELWCVARTGVLTSPPLIITLTAVASRWSMATGSCCWQRVESRSKPGRFYWRCGAETRWSRPNAALLVERGEAPALAECLPVELTLAILAHYLQAQECARLAATNRGTFLLASADTIWLHRIVGTSHARGDALRVFGADVALRADIHMRADRAGREFYYATHGKHIEDPCCRNLVGSAKLLADVVPPGTTRGAYTAHVEGQFPGLLAADELALLNRLGPRGLRYYDLRFEDPSALRWIAKDAFPAVRCRDDIRACLRLQPGVRFELTQHHISNLRSFLDLSAEHRAKEEAKLESRFKFRRLRERMARRFGASGGITENVVRDREEFFYRPEKKTHDDGSSRSILSP